MSEQLYGTTWIGQPRLYWINNMREDAESHIRVGTREQQHRIGQSG